MWNSAICDYESDKASKIDEYLDIKNFSCKKGLFGKLLIACEDEILNTSKTLFLDKKVI